MKYKLNLLHKKEKKHGTTLSNEEILKKKKKKALKNRAKKMIKHKEYIWLPGNKKSFYTGTHHHIHKMRGQSQKASPGILYQFTE